jgi:hypothetical protein
VSYVVTLLAVVVGGLLTYLTQWRLDGRRAKREADREQAQAEAELRVAKRLLLEELDTLALQHQLLVNQGHYPQPLSTARGASLFPTEAWEANKRTLAGALSDDEWAALSPVMHTAASSRLIVLEGEPLQPIEPHVRDALTKGVDAASSVYEMLAGQPPPSLKLGTVPGKATRQA